MSDRTLSPRQYEVVRRLAMDGNVYHATALELGIAWETVARHTQAARRKLGCVGASRTDLLVTALQRGEVTLDELVAPAHVLGRPR